MPLSQASSGAAKATTHAKPRTGLAGGRAVSKVAATHTYSWRETHAMGVLACGNIQAGLQQISTKHLLHSKELDERGVQ